MKNRQLILRKWTACSTNNGIFIVLVPQSGKCIDYCIVAKGSIELGYASSFADADLQLHSSTSFPTFTPTVRFQPPSAQLCNVVFFYSFFLFLQDNGYHACVHSTAYKSQSIFHVILVVKRCVSPMIISPCIPFSPFFLPYFSPIRSFEACTQWEVLQNTPTLLSGGGHSVFSRPFVLPCLHHIQQMYEPETKKGTKPSGRVSAR